jgi:hypothetical protein
MVPVPTTASRRNARLVYCFRLFDIGLLVILTTGVNEPRSFALRRFLFALRTC